MNSKDVAKTKEPKDQRFSPPIVSLPKGGGAIKGIGEKFAANPVTGTGSLSIPLPLSPGRSGFTPALSLSYDSGAGNGPYGFGWNVGYPSITRRTDRGLPKYLDHEESDVYILSGAEDLVPVVMPDGSRFEEHRGVYHVTRYRPRIEGLFARIERWTNLTDHRIRTGARSLATTAPHSMARPPQAESPIRPIQLEFSPGCSASLLTTRETPPFTSIWPKTAAMWTRLWQVSPTAARQAARPTAI